MYLLLNRTKGIYSKYYKIMNNRSLMIRLMTITCIFYLRFIKKKAQYFRVASLSGNALLTKFQSANLITSRIQLANV